MFGSNEPIPTVGTIVRRNIESYLRLDDWNKRTITSAPRLATDMQHVRKTKRATDQGRPTTGSQQVQTMMSLLAKPQGDEKEVHQFRKKVAEDRRALNTLLQRRLEQAERHHARRQNEMSAVIAEALTRPNKTTSRERTTFETTKIASNGIYHSALMLDAARRSMMSDYAGLEATIAKMAGSNMNTVTEKWVQDIEREERLLKLGHKTAVKHVKKVLGAEVQGEETRDGETPGEETEGGEKGIGVQGKLNMELLQGLRYAERGVKRMVKGVPKDGH
ncbi:hypothetical protein PMIN04_002617 [Paraphaeosphaeria minitans]